MFAEDARRATLDAAKLAGIEVIELINEPTALFSIMLVFQVLKSEEGL